MSVVKRSLSFGLAVLVAVMMLSCLGVSGTLGSGVLPAGGDASFEDPLTVTKLKGGPQESKVVRALICDGYYSVWHHWVENSGLKSLTIEIFEGLDENGVLLSSTEIVFADYGAFPTGIVELPDFQPNHAQLYNFVFTPVGHKGTQASYYHDLEEKYAPVTVVDRTDDLNVVTLDASRSYDPDGWIVSYEWHWSDGVVVTEPVSSHYFVPGGFLSATLTIVDNDGLSAMMIVNLGWW